MPSGQFLQPTEVGPPAAGSQPAVESALSAHVAKHQQQYVPAGALLDPVTTTTTITAHVSPDAGLATLQDFLEGTQK